MRPVEEHGLLGFRRACRCEVCEEANRAYMREWRARKHGLPAGHPANDTGPALKVAPAPPAGPETDTTGEGRVARGVRTEIGFLSGGVVERHSGLVETALTLAAGLDNPKLATTHPSLARQLMAALVKLHAASVGGRGKLASVSSLSPAGPPPKSS